MAGMQIAIDRHAFRRHALDGAALYFQPSTGTHVRVATAATRASRRRAPRVAMFGITNACNLRCDFCSRDVTRKSAWTVASAAAALRGLHDAGTLEVAYGGGEPFAFRGFAELVSELHETTALAQHVTTNGTLIDAPSWRAFAGKLGQVRISIYEQAKWRRAAAVLAESGQLWGGNVLVDAAQLATLPALLGELAALGCADVSLLSYVGPERARHLDGEGARQLAEVIEAAPLPCRLSVCFGDRVAVPRLPTGDGASDCGAGHDFLSITPDQRVQSCSFQERSLPGATAEEILSAWRTQQAQLAQPSPRAGCARLLPMADAEQAPPPISIWRGFSGNNSGECMLVATFRGVADAEAYLAELLPSWVPDGRYPPEWKQLFADEGVEVPGSEDGDDYEHGFISGAPRELAGLGKLVMGAAYGLGEMFPDLAALAWKRGALVTFHGMRWSNTSTLVAVVRSTSAEDRQQLLDLPLGVEAVKRCAHGELVIATIPTLNGPRTAQTLMDARDAVLALAGDRGFAAELYPGEIDERELVEGKQRLGHKPAQVPRLWVRFGSDAKDRKISFAGILDDDRVVSAGGGVLIDPAPDRKRLAVLGYRHGGSVRAFDSAELILDATIWYPEPAMVKQEKGKPRPPKPKKRLVDAGQMEAALRASLPGGTSLQIVGQQGRDPKVEVTTEEPAVALAVLASYAQSVEAKLGVWIREPDPVGALMRRLVAAV
jgi:Radical SAM superfamily